MSSIGVISPQYVQQTYTSALQSSGLSVPTASSAGAGNSDSTQLSSFSKLVGALEKLQQSDPTEYSQVTSEIAANLTNAAQTAEAQGNSAAAKQLTQLASDFTTASQSGKLPNLDDLSQAVNGSGGGGGHHHHHHSEASSDSSAATSSASASSAGATASSTASTSSSINPAAVISQALNSAGISL